MNDFPKNKPGFWLWHTALQWRLQLSRNLKPLKLTTAQFFVLGALYGLERGGKSMPTHRTIMQHASLDAMMTSRLLKKLEDNGLVERHADRNDARKQRFITTDSGKQLAETASAEAARTDSLFFQGVSVPEFEAALRELYEKSIRIAKDESDE
jgi:DNA-binding MarR family transcriptional regulator